MTHKRQFGFRAQRPSFRLLIWVAVLFMTGFLLAQEAQAAIVDNSAAFTQFRCVGSAPINAVAANCSAAMGAFGRVLCIFESVLSEVMSKFFCAMQFYFLGPLQKALILFVTLFGVALMTGMTRFSARDAVTAFFKVVLVWVFATQADFTIGIAYNFFISFATEGSRIVMGSINGSTGGGLLASPDNFLGGFFTNSAPGPGGVVNTITLTDPTTFANVSLDPVCAMTLGMLLLALLLFLPTVILFLAMFLISLLGLFARALLGYFTALILISFLILLAPIFLSFALFNMTRDLFEQWLKHLGTNALQMVVLFAFYAMVMMIDFVPFFVKLLGMLMPYNLSLVNLIAENFPAWLLGPLNIKLSVCTICNYEMLPAGVPAYMQTPSCILTAGKPTAMPITDIATKIEFIMWVVSRLFTLLILSHIFSDFLKKAPEIAKHMGGVRYAAILGGGSSMPSYAAFGSNIRFAGLGALGGAWLAFKDGVKRRGPLRGMLGFMPTRLRAGFKEGMAAFAHGYTPPHVRQEIERTEVRLNSARESLASARRAAVISANVAQHVTQQQQEGKSSTAAAAAALLAHKLALKNEQRQQNKVKQTLLRLDTLKNARQYQSKPGLGRELEETFMGVDPAEDQDPFSYQAQRGKDNWFYLLQEGTDATVSAEEFQRMNIENMQAYAVSRADSVEQKLAEAVKDERISSISEGHIHRELDDTREAINRSDADEMGEALDRLNKAARKLDWEPQTES